MSKKEQAEENRLKALLLHLQIGLLPGETVPSEDPTRSDLLSSAAGHAEDHAKAPRSAAVVARGAADGAAAAGAAAAGEVAAPRAAAAGEAEAGGDDPDHDDEPFMPRVC